MNAQAALPDSVNGFLDFLTQEYNFKTISVVTNGDAFSVTSKSDLFGVRIYNDFRVICLCLFKQTRPDREIDIYNLLWFIQRNHEHRSETNDFEKVKDVDECFRLQIQWIASTFQSNYQEIAHFFTTGNYTRKLKALRQYVIDMNPHMFVCMKEKRTGRRHSGKRAE